MQNSSVLSTALKDWIPYEGAWVSDQGTLGNLRNGRGDKLVSNSAVPDDLLFSAELRFDSESDMQWGDSGVILRATNLARGTDAFYGYYLGLRPVSRELLLGREEFDYVNLAIKPLSEPLELGAWYRLQVRARGCHLEASAFNKQGDEIGSASLDDRNCRSLRGAVGLRSYSMLTSWRHLVVRELR